MLENLLASSPLPNLHPALVHFPLALLPLAAACDVLTIATARRWLDRLAVLLYALGVAGSWWAAEAGEHAAESFVDLPATIEPEIAEHSDMAHYALYAFALVLAVRLFFAVRDRAEERVRSRGLRALPLLIVAAGLFFLFETAEHGAALVYRHGLGISPDATMFAGSARPEPEPAATPGSEVAPEPAARLRRGAEGSLLWTPVAGDESALGTVLLPVSGFASGAVEAAPRSSSGPGLAVQVLARAILVFEPEYDDVRVEAEVELDDFQGTVGVAHHVRGAEAASWFEVTTQGEAALRLSQGGSILTLEEAETEAPARSVRIAVSVAGGHRKGMLDGAVVVHGHIESSEGGRVGLLFDGRGEVVVRRVTVEPLD